MTSARRPLEDMIGELADSMIALPETQAGGGLRTTRIELTLPVETRVTRGPAGVRIEADMPRTHTRTDFDLPVGRFTLTLAEVPIEAVS